MTIDECSMFLDAQKDAIFEPVLLLSFLMVLYRNTWYLRNVFLVINDCIKTTRKS